MTGRVPGRPARPPDPAADGASGHDRPVTGAQATPHGPAATGRATAVRRPPGPTAPRVARPPTTRGPRACAAQRHWPVRTRAGRDGQLPEARPRQRRPVQTGQWTIPVAGGDCWTSPASTGSSTPAWRPAPHGTCRARRSGRPGRPRHRRSAGDRAAAAAVRPQRAAAAGRPVARRSSRSSRTPTQVHTDQAGHSGQWSVPTADEGADDSGEYAVEGHPGPAARTGAPARRPLRIPDDDSPREHSAPATPPHGTPRRAPPAHGTPPHARTASPRTATPDGAFVRERELERDDRHASPAAPGGLPDEAAWHGEFTDGTGTHGSAAGGPAESAMDAPPPDAHPGAGAPPHGGAVPDGPEPAPGARRGATAPAEAASRTPRSSPPRRTPPSRTPPPSPVRPRRGRRPGEPADR